MSTLTDRLPDLAGLLDNLADAERRDLEDAFLRVLALSQRSRPAALPPQIPPAEPERAAAARAATLAHATEARAELATGSSSTADVARRLGVSSAAVTKRRTKGDLVAFRHRGDWRYPTWQFDGDETRLDVLAVWQALPQRSAVGRVRWFTLPSRHLDGATPMQALDGGDTARVIDAATYVGAR